MGNFSICRTPHLINSRTYFQEVQTKEGDFFPGAAADNLKSKIKLEFTIENIDLKKKYNLVVKFSDSQSLFNTETVMSQLHLITFNTCYIGDYYFEKQQILNIYLIQDGNQIGMLKVTLGNIVGSPGSVYKTSFNNNINISIAAQGLSNSNSYITVKLKARTNNNTYDFSKPANKISYVITSQGRKIYSSESIDNIGKFSPQNIPGYLLEKGFNIQFLDGYQEFIISKDDNIQNFCTPNQNPYLFVSSQNQMLNIINKSVLHQEVTFLDYIKAGVRIKLSIGIDYTGSNKNPTDPTSLHYLGPNMNDYEQAIQACGMIVAYYDYNQKFPVYGYGALLNGESQVNMCFNVNCEEDPEIYTIDNVLKEYRKSFNYLKLAGPTKFAPLVQRVNYKIKIENDPLKYHILLILTDGVIFDQQETIDALVEGSFLPLSVIIIGIGNDHFQEMIELDGDDNPITDSKGVKRARDLVQFVPFNKYKNNPTKLAEQVLEEVPRQIIEYYNMNNIYPSNIQAINQINNRQQIMNNMNNTNSINSMDLPSYTETYNNNDFDPNRIKEMSSQYKILNIHNSDF